MTKVQLKQVYENWNAEIGKLGKRQMEIFHQLQDLCAKHGDGHKWCNINMLAEKLISAGFVSKTMDLIEEYYRISGQMEALEKLAQATNNFDI